MRNGGIGKGWYPEELLEDDSLQILATGLLRQKLDDIFKIFADKHKQQMENKNASKTLR